MSKSCWQQLKTPFAPMVCDTTRLTLTGTGGARLVVVVAVARKPTAVLKER